MIARLLRAAGAAVEIVQILHRANVLAAAVTGACEGVAQAIADQLMLEKPTSLALEDQLSPEQLRELVDSARAGLARHEGVDRFAAISELARHVVEDPALRIEIKGPTS